MRAGLKRIVEKKVRASFLKKRSKKLLVLGGVGTRAPRPSGNKSFFASFFSKKEALALPLCLSKQESRGCQLSLA
jgi:hypothetical protein